MNDFLFLSCYISICYFISVFIFLYFIDKGINYDKELKIRKRNLSCGLIICSFIWPIFILIVIYQIIAIAIKRKIKGKNK